MTAPTGCVRVTNARIDMAPDSQPEEGETVVAVDRTNPVLGNPHRLSNKLDRVERARVIELFRRDLVVDLVTGGPMYAEIDALARRVVAGERICLQCHCRPLPCHADLIAEAVEARIAELVQ